MTTTRSTRAVPKPSYRSVALQDKDGECFARYVWHRYRFMFSDGATLDVNAIRDDSDLREAVLIHHYGKKIMDPKDGSIVGVARLSVEEEQVAATPVPARRRSVPRPAGQPVASNDDGERQDGHVNRRRTKAPAATKG